MRWTGHDYIKQYEIGRSHGTHVRVVKCVQGYRGTPWRKSENLKYLSLDTGIILKQWRTQEFCSGGEEIQQIQLRTEDRQNGDLGAVAP